jgi:hypothetical protein
VVRREPRVTGSEADRPRISVVVSTRNRASRIGCCIESLAGLRSRHSFEIVLVDNASTDETPARLEDFAKRHGDRLSVRCIEARVPGVSRGRNAGIAASRGEIVAFTDDDCHPTPDWLDTVADAFDSSPDLGYVGGRIVLHDPDDAPHSIQVYPKIRMLPARGYVAAGVILGANMAMRRSVLDAIAGFDTRMGIGTPFPAEDLDLQARASAAGFAGAYFPTSLVAHHHGRRDPETIRVLRRGYAQGRGAHFCERLVCAETRSIYLPRILRHWRKRPHWILPELQGASGWLRARRAPRATSL